MIVIVQYSLGQSLSLCTEYIMTSNVWILCCMDEHNSVYRHTYYYDTCILPVFAPYAKFVGIYKLNLLEVCKISGYIACGIKTLNKSNLQFLVPLQLEQVFLRILQMLDIPTLE